jgi:hypothetical protein
MIASVIEIGITMSNSTKVSTKIIGTPPSKIAQAKAK